MRPAYCYRRSVVCVYVCVCLLVTVVNCAKTTEAIETPFAMWTRVTAPAGGRRNFGRLPARSEVQRISGVRQGCSVGGSSDAAVRCQYCSNLLGLGSVVAAAYR